jgi:hypothetical protein
MGRAAYLWALAFVIGIVAVALTPNDWYLHGYMPDAAVDKYTAQAAVDGLDTTQPWDTIANYYGLYEGGTLPFPAPRTPAAYFLHQPLLAIPDVALIPLVGILNVTGIIGTCWAASRISGFSPFWLAWLAMVLLTLTDYWHANSGWVVAPALAVGWMLVGRRRWAGVLFGIAAALKIWPILVIVALLLRPKTRRDGVMAMATAAVLSAAGLLFQGVSAMATLEAFVETTSIFVESPLNLSLPAFFTLLGLNAAIGSAVALSLWGWMSWRLDNRYLLPASVVFGLLASPVSWVWYWYAAIPAVAVILQLHRSEGHRLPTRRRYGLGRSPSRPRTNSAFQTPTTLPRAAAESD